MSELQKVKKENQALKQKISDWREIADGLFPAGVRIKAEKDGKRLTRYGLARISHKGAKKGKLL